MNWSNLIRKIVISLLQDVFGIKRTRSGTGTYRTRSTTQRNRRGTATSRRTASRTAYNSSDDTPGRYGNGATRDATAAEITKAKFGYSPNHDGDPDPGEVIWTWVPYAENDGRGKDRPVLILGSLGANSVIGCYLSTKQHRGFINIGQGPWDAEQRNSYLSPERVLRITTSGMRREAAQVSKQQYEAVYQKLTELGVFS